MNDGRIAVMQEEERVWVESIQVRRENLEELFAEAEQAITRAEDAVTRSPRPPGACRQASRTPGVMRRPRHRP